MIYILAFFVSIIPAALVVVWLMKRDRDDLYRQSCRYALKRGALSIFPIIGASAAFNILSALLFKDAPVLVYQAIYKFIVLALAEELVKFLTLKKVLKDHQGACSWADVTAFMVIIGSAFGLVEDIPYAIGASPMVMLVRGITTGHTGYGFIMGWFYGKKLYTGKKGFGVIAFVLPWLFHGLYDFSLTEELLAVNDNLAVIAVSLALMDIVLLVLTIRFFRRSRRIERYNEPLACFEASAPEQLSSMSEDSV
ncbi:MAG: PrsW family intramembrane metalloprotease [Firmicutes bacterium]|nr:PrsW family intramembrane metalloprotease [Bacillota bacterium]